MKITKQISKTLITIVVLMSFLCACGTSSSEITEAVKGYQKDLMRPDTLLVRDVYLLKGQVYDDETINSSTMDFDEDEKAEYSKKCNYVYVRCSFENAGGTVVEGSFVYDLDGKQYYIIDADELDRLVSVPGYNPSRIEAFAMNMYYGWDFYFEDGTLEQLSDSDIDSINKQLK